MRKVEIFILGCGKTARELIALLDHHWQVTVLDLEQGRLDRLASQPNVRCVLGDGTSEMVLRRAGAKRAQYAVACTTDDEANLAFCSLMRRCFNTTIMVAMVASLDAASALDRIGGVTINRARACASMIRNRIETGVVEATGIGAGRGEVLEVHLHESSYYAGLTVGDLPSRDFRLAALYRGDRLFLPEPELVLLPRDRVLLVGDPAVLRGVADAFGSGDLQFPRQYGHRILLPLLPFLLPSDDTIDEVVYLAQSSRASGIDVLPVVRSKQIRPGRKQSDDVAFVEDRLARLLAVAAEHDVGVHQAEAVHDPLSGLIAAAAEPGVGVVVLPAERIGFTQRILGMSFSAGLVDAVDVPVLFSRGSHPWNEIVVPCRDEAESRRALEIGVDVSRMDGARVLALQIYADPFADPIGTFSSKNTALEGIDIFLVELAKLHRKEVHVERVNGNPVRSVIARSHKARSVVMLETTGMRPRTILRPDVAFHIAHFAECSVMVLPRRMRPVRGAKIEFDGGLGQR